MNLQLSPGQWHSLFLEYGINEKSLTGNAAPCPICGGTDRFTFDNKRGRGDWVCRKCNNGSPAAGDGLQLICRAAGVSFRELANKLEGRPATSFASATPRQADHPARTSISDAAHKAARLERIWRNAEPLRIGDRVMRYLEARVPGLNAGRSSELRLATLPYCLDRTTVIGHYPAIVSRYLLPDGRVATLHRTYLDPSKDRKAVIVSSDGEILESKKNEVRAHELKGGAVRMMAPVDGEIGVAEGLETAYAAWMIFGVPMWWTLNRVQLAQFVVPEGLGIKRVHIFADFDAVDPKTHKSPGMADALTLQKRLRAEGYSVVLHRPRSRGTDFADEWMTSRAATQAAVKTRDVRHAAVA
jgi:putative DNA primase/helicase